MHTIVFGDDRSPGADLAWMWLTQQQWSGWRVDVVTVPETELGPPHLSGAPGAVPWTPEDPRDAPEASGLVSVRHLTADADPRVVLSARSDADLLVVGATGGGFLKRWLHVGSTTEWLLHDPPAPLVVARTGRRVRRVLVGVDGSESSGRALEAFASLPWAPSTEVHVLGVHDGWVEPGSALADADAVLATAGIEHRTEQARGRAAEVLVSRARHDHVDLVVLGVRGASKLRRVVAGATASSVTRACDSSVLLVP